MASDPRRVARAVLGALALTAAAAAAYALWPTPQLGADDEVFRTVDALYTAVRDEDVRRLGECESRLRAYAEVGRLPPPAARRLQAVVAAARAGRWRPAAESLYDFMRAQRRDAPPTNAKGRR